MLPCALRISGLNFFYFLLQRREKIESVIGDSHLSIDLCSTGKQILKSHSLVMCLGNSKLTYLECFVEPETDLLIEILLII